MVVRCIFTVSKFYHLRIQIPYQIYGSDYKTRQELLDRLKEYYYKFLMNSVNFQTHLHIIISIIHHPSMIYDGVNILTHIPIIKSINHVMP